jgi:hypothetical protein
MTGVTKTNHVFIRTHSYALMHTEAENINIQHFYGIAARAGKYYLSHINKSVNNYKLCIQE